MQDAVPTSVWDEAVSQATAVVRAGLPRCMARAVQKALRCALSSPCSIMHGQLVLSLMVSAQANAALDHADGSSISGVTDRVSEARALLCFTLQVLALAYHTC